MSTTAMRRGGVAALSLAAIASVWWLMDRPQHAGAPSSHETTATPDWLARLKENASDATLAEFLRSDLERSRKIETLVALIRESTPDRQPALLDVLASLQPIEATRDLAAMLKAARDPKLAVVILRTLRAATLATSSEIRTGLTDKELATAFELIQAVFRDEFTRPPGDPARFRTAVAAIADVFPAEEATAIFKSLAEKKPLPLGEAELFGYWLGFSVGAVDGRDFQQITEFVRQHPQSVSDERVKARILDQLAITPIRPDESTQLAPLIDLLAPAEAPDDSFVRWLDVKSRLTGAAADIPALLRSASPMQKAALIHFGNPGTLDPAGGNALKAELTTAAAALPDSEARDFLEQAAAAISLGSGKPAP